MSRLNYLTEEELALVGIDQDLRLLERLVADGLELSAERLQTLANCKDRISRLIAPTRNLTKAGGGDLEPVRSTSSATKQAIDPCIKQPSAKELRQSIHRLLDEVTE